MNGLKSLYFHLFFQSRNGLRIDFFRFLFFMFIFFLYIPSHLADFSRVPDALWDPHPTYLFLNLPSYSADSFIKIEALFLIFIIFSALGFLTNLSILMTTILYFVVVAINKSFLSTEFHQHLPFLTMIVLLFSKCSGKFSIDNLIFKGVKAVDESWPFRIILFATCMMYFNAAISKVRNSGFSWFNGESLQVALNQSFQNFYLIDYAPLKSILLQLYNDPHFLIPTAFLVFAFEILSPLALLSAKQTKLWILLWVAFHVAIFISTGIYSSINFIPIFIGLYPYSQNFLDKLRILPLKFH